MRRMRLEAGRPARKLQSKEPSRDAGWGVPQPLPKAHGGTGRGLNRVKREGRGGASPSDPSFADGETVAHGDDMGELA